MRPEHWKGRPVLVTGADGFIGSHLTERLVAEGADVRAFTLYNSFGKAGWLDSLSGDTRDRLEILAGDVRDAQQVEAALEGRDVVFHLAALISVPFSFEAPESFVDTNVRGTLNVLRGARRTGTRVVHTSTSEVYGTPETVPIREGHPLHAQSPYAASKIGADQLAESFHAAYELPVVILRPFNTYGPRQSARAVLMAILTQLVAGRDQLQLGALWPRRDLTYVEDTVDGFLRAGAVDAAIGRTIQLGTGRDVSVGELAEIAMDVVGRRVEIVTEDKRLRPGSSEVHRLLSDPALAAEVLGWTPRITVEEGVARTAAWLRDRLDAYRVEEYAI